MTGQLLSLIIGAIIVYFAVKALIRTFKNTKEGKCAGCSGNCSMCSLESKDNGGTKLS